LVSLPALQAKVKLWQESYVVLDLAMPVKRRCRRVDPAPERPTLIGQWGFAAWHLCEPS
jgi:hypothetical protein